MEVRKRCRYKSTNLFLKVISLSWKLKSFRDEREVERRQPGLGSEAASAREVVHLLVWLKVAPRFWG